MGRTVHPHARGENKRLVVAQPFGHGSPPRARGKQVRQHPGCQTPRFTPTRVGKTSRPLSLPSSSPGSPPRAWGKRICRTSPRSCPRFTPTRVGKTPTSVGPRLARAVHPHARGENVEVTITVRRAHGSPPRAWGKLFAMQHDPGVRRFTPTRVGKTPALPPD